MAPTIERIGSGCACNLMRVLIRLTAPTHFFGVIFILARRGFRTIHFGWLEHSVNVYYLLVVNRKTTILGKQIS